MKIVCRHSADEIHLEVPVNMVKFDTLLSKIDILRTIKYFLRLTIRCITGFLNKLIWEYLAEVEVKPKNKMEECATALYL